MNRRELLIGAAASAAVVSLPMPALALNGLNTTQQIIFDKFVYTLHRLRQYTYPQQYRPSEEQHKMSIDLTYALVKRDIVSTPDNIMDTPCCLFKHRGEDVAVTTASRLYRSQIDDDVDSTCRMFGLDIIDILADEMITEIERWKQKGEYYPYVPVIPVNRVGSNYLPVILFKTRYGMLV